MVKDYKISEPFFEYGPKCYMYGETLVEMAKGLDLMLVPYENEEGMAATKKALEGLKEAKSVGIFIGPEGGFEQKEIELAIRIKERYYGDK